MRMTKAIELIILMLFGAILPALIMIEFGNDYNEINKVELIRGIK